MNFSSFPTKDSPNVVDAERLSRAKPVLFLHIPKTAGTSFLTVLGNVFGERRVRRLGGADETTQAQIDRIVADEIQDVDCLVGHFPIHRFAKCLDAFRPFTILRDPVDRVMSLFRFFKRSPEKELSELPDGFGFDDFIESRVPHNYAQTRNMMCRMLCGDEEMSDPSAAAFWQPRDPGAVVDQALATLRGIDFGLVEDMQSTRVLLRHAWATTFDLGEYRKNATGRPGAEWTARNIQRIIDLNTLDIALYHEAKALFYERVRDVSALGQMPADDATSPPVLRVQPGQEISVNDIPGRRGFLDFQRGSAWLAANQTVLIGFVAPPKMLRLRMTLYCVTDRYPAEEIEVTLNGTRLTHRVAPIKDSWVSLETEAFLPKEKLNLLRLSPPYVIPVRFLDPASKDDRYLSVALAKLVFLEVLCVQPGQEISVNDIPGRQGFHEFEPGNGFAWLAANQTVLIEFHAPPKLLRLRMTLYCITDRFPAEEIEVTLNGARLTHRVAPLKGNWVSLETEAFRPNEKLNVLTLSPPYAIPARFLHPESKDDRYLSVALEKLVFLEGEGCLPAEDDS